MLENIGIAFKVLCVGICLCIALPKNGMGGRLHTIAESDNVEELHRIVATKNKHEIEKLLIEKNQYDDTPFHTACFHGQINFLHNLIELYPQGVNLDGYTNFRPIHTATSRGHFEIVKLLYDRGAQMNVRDASDNTPLHIALANNYNNIVQFIAEKAPELIEISTQKAESPLHYVARKGDKIQLSILIGDNNRKVNLDCLDYYGNAPLHVAALNDKDAAAKFLVESGADVHKRTRDHGGTVLHCAASRSLWNWKSFYNLLIGKGVEYDENYYKERPSDILKESSNLYDRTQNYSAKQMQGSHYITTKQSQVSLFFKICDIGKGGLKFRNCTYHAHVAFESLDSSTWDTTMRIVDLTSDDGIKIRKDKKDVDDYIMAGVYSWYPGRPVEHVFRWQVDSTLAEDVWNTILKQVENKSIKFGWISYNCVDYALDILKKCGIDVKTNSPKKLIEHLQNL